MIILTYTYYTKKQKKTYFKAYKDFENGKNLVKLYFNENLIIMANIVPLTFQSIPYNSNKIVFLLYFVIYMSI